MRVGVFQCDGSGLTPNERLIKLESNLKEVELDLMVCPELFVSGYNTGDQLLKNAEPKIGSVSNRAAKIARTTNTAIVYGYPEKDGDQLYNSALCIDQSGAIVANHRKLMIPPGFELNYFAAGSDTTFFQLGGMTCAILVCYDVEYPEAVRHVAQSGAHIVVVPTALADNWGVVSEKLIPTRAFENGVWLVYANHCGVEGELKYYGGSCIVDPQGRDVARADATECVISANVDLESVDMAQTRLPYLKGADALNRKLN